jgi:hypothetical protein
MQAQSLVRTTPASASLYEILALILDKGLVIDISARVSLFGIEMPTIKARIVIPSLDTFWRHTWDIGIRGRSSTTRRPDALPPTLDEEIGAAA